MCNRKVIIVSPSLDPRKNVSGISSITQFIINNNPECQYIHFELGKKDNERGGILRIISVIKCIINWWIILSKNEEAIIHYNFPLSKASILRDPIFIYIAYIRKRKTVIHIHGGIFLTSPQIPLYLHIILKRVFSLKFPFIVLSNIEKNQIKIRFNCKNVYILPNCVDLEEAKTFIREKNLNNKLKIGYLGRIAESKGMDYLLKACIELKKKNIPFLLELAGKEESENKYLPIFKEKLGDNFSYVGVISGNSKSNFLKDIDIFILPSFFEGLPMSLIESMSFGVVPLTTNVGSIGEVVNDKLNGLFINIKDSDSIVNNVLYLNSNREVLNKLSSEAKKFIFRSFDVTEYINKLNSIYSSIF